MQVKGLRCIQVILVIAEAVVITEQMPVFTVDLFIYCQQIFVDNTILVLLTCQTFMILC